MVQVCWLAKVFKQIFPMTAMHGAGRVVGSGGGVGS